MTLAITTRRRLAVGLLAALQLPYGIPLAQAQQAAETKYQYDAQGNLVQIKDAKPFYGVS